MPEIRINNIPTTATSTASDDFFAIDGSNNNTRKISAYSPTFGGNLTVSGTDVKINNAAGYFYVDSGSSLTGMSLSRTNNILELLTANTTRLTISSAGNTTLSGNLTVSGGQALTVGSSANYSLWKDGTPTKAGRVILNNAVTNGLSLGLYDGSSWVDTLHIHPTNNNVLIGTNIDGGQKLQVSGTAYISGATTLGGNLTVNTSGNSFVELLSSAVEKAKWQLSGDNIFLDCNSGTLNLRTLSANNITLRTNSTVALTIDSSQNATFAGNLTVSGASYLSGNSWFNLGSYSGTRALNFYYTGTNRQAFISSTGGGNFTGDIRFGVNGVTSDTDAIEVARINSVGLHIGPAGNASAPLQIENATTTSSRQAATGLRLSSPAGSGQTTPSIEFTNSVGTGAAIDSIRTAASYASSLRFFTSIAGGDVPTLALTLDSSQNATLAGNLTVSGTGTSSIGGNTKIGNPANANQRLVVDGAVAGVGVITTNTGLSGGYLYSDGGTGGVVAAWNGGNYSALSILGNTVTIGTGASGTTAATISSGGNVGIGTTSPLGVLDVRSTTPDVLFNGKDTADPVLYFGRYQYDNVSKSGAAIKYVHGSAGGSQEYGRLAFLTATGSFGALTERMRINENGNFLIGTTSDTGEKLQVSGTIASSTATPENGQLQLNVGRQTLNDTWGIQLGNTYAPIARILGRTDSAGNGTGSLLFYTGTGGGTPALALTLDSSQNATFAASLTTVGRVLNTSVKTANYTVATSNHVIICNSASAFTITMIAASSNTGRQFIIKNKGAGEITVDATSLGQIDGLNTITLSQYQSTMLVSDGTTWNRI
jgi:hypothetical protein